ncbi:MAG: hypothetical protein AB4042_17455 [Leptolyngbyaceae cyanobacterium]
MMKQANYDPLTRRVRQICLLCEATGKTVTRINYGFCNRLATDTVRVHTGEKDLFEVYQVAPHRIKALYYRWLDGEYAAAKGIDINGFLKGVGRQAYFEGLPFNPRWGQESLGYLIGYQELANPSLPSF